MISLVIARQEDQVITNILSLIVSILERKRGERERDREGRERSGVCFQEMDILQAKDFAHTPLKLFCHVFPFFSIARPSTLHINVQFGTKGCQQFVMLLAALGTNCWNGKSSQVLTHWLVKYHSQAS